MSKVFKKGQEKNSKKKNSTSRRKARQSITTGEGAETLIKATAQRPMIMESDRDLMRAPRYVPIPQPPSQHHEVQ